MGIRREGRQAAIQFLYQNDLNLEAAQSGMEAFWSLCSVPPNARKFGMELVQGILSHKDAIDQKIQQAAANYDLQRLAVVDRNILRMGVYEMLHGPALPPAIVINEAIEIAKRFGAEDSGRFINGVLDRIRQELPAT